MRKKITLVLIFAFISAFAVIAQSEIRSNEQEIRNINLILDTWHERATTADTTYFDLFAENAMYLGTDSKEIWTSKEFKVLYMSYFKRGKAWDFKKVNRNVYFGNIDNYAWIDEILDTWMGLCRGTAVIEKNSVGDWRIKHYSLTVLVPNELIKNYVLLLKPEK